MKILLIKGPRKNVFSSRMPLSLDWGVYPPLGLGYVAAVLEKNGYEVKIFDFEVGNWNWDRIREKILKENADVVGITSVTQTFQEDLKIAKIAKEGNSVVVFGGPQIDAYPKESVSFDCIDYGIAGDGEFAMLELMKHLENGIKPKNVAGVLYKEDGNVKINSQAIVKNLDSLPFPARHLMPINLYRFPLSKNPFTTMLTSRGCPYHCGFCFKRLTDKYFRLRSPHNIVDEIEECVESYRIKEIVFYDDSFGLVRKQVIKLCEEIVERDLDVEWEARMRIDSVDRNLLIKMKKAGCKRLRYGIESGDQKILNLMKKDINLKKVERVIKETKRVGIQTFGYFIIGYAHETPLTIMKTIKFSTKLELDWAIFTVAVPLPKTHLLQLAEESGLIKEDCWRNYTFGKNVDSVPYLIADANKWLNRAYKNFYFRLKFILSRLKRLNSFRLLKYYLNATQGIVFLCLKRKK